VILAVELVTPSHDGMRDESLLRGKGLARRPHRAQHRSTSVGVSMGIERPTCRKGLRHPLHEQQGSVHELAVTSCAV
jgi:hypothetical protein